MAARSHSISRRPFTTWENCAGVKSTSSAKVCIWRPWRLISVARFTVAFTTTPSAVTSKTFPSRKIVSPSGNDCKYSYHMEIMEDSVPPFAAWLQRQIRRRGWSGAELSRRTDIPPATISRWVNGLRAPRDGDHIRRLSDALSVHQDEILEQLDMRDGGADHMSLAVRRLQPLIDSLQWDEGLYRLVEGQLESLRAMQAGQFTEPRASWEDEE